MPSAPMHIPALQPRPWHDHEALPYLGDDKTKCVCISDAGELANPNSKSRSIIGHVLILKGNIVSFKLKLSTCVNTDASHAELVGLYAATKKIKCIEFIFLSMHPIMLENHII